MKLKINSIEEVHFLSGLIQGGVFQLSMCKLKGDNFIIHNLNRFMWETNEYERIHTNISIYNIAHCTVPKINKRQFLIMLAIIAVDHDHIRIYCTNLIVIEIYLKSTDIEMFMDDIGSPWVTNSLPFTFQN